MAVVAAAHAPTGKRQSKWIQSRAWDSLWMFSAFWATALFYVAKSLVGMETAVVVVLAASPIVALLHAWSTTFMVLGSPLLADERRARPIKYLVIPAVIVVVCMTLGLMVAHTQRFPEDGRLTAAMWPWTMYISLLWVGHFWHFGKQDFGVLSIYRQKAGQHGARDRRVDSIYTSLMMFVIQPIVYVNFTTTTPFGEIAGTFIPISRATLDVLTTGGLALALLAYVAVVALELVRSSRSVPKLLYYTIIVAHPILLAASIHGNHLGLGYAYLIFYVWSHWFIAIGLVSRINVRFGQSQGLSLGRSVLRHASTLLIIGSVVSFTYINWGRYSLFNTSDMAYKDVLASITPSTMLFIGLVMGFFLSEQILHYYCDRTLFRFSDAGVRRRVAPLL